MALLPGVPNMGPAPISPVGPGAHTTVGKGAPHGIAAIAASVGKPGRVQHLGSLVGRQSAGMTGIAGGNSAAHSMGHYGKAPPLLGGSLGMAGGVDPTAHAGAKVIRGGSGGIRAHVREGGLGPGPMSRPGNSSNYSMSSMDQE